MFQCELCPTTCGRKTDLRLHMQKLHTSDKALHCKMCGKSFPDRYTLKVHKKTHEGEKCFKCDLCPYSRFVFIYILHNTYHFNLTIHYQTWSLHLTENYIVTCQNCEILYQLNVETEEWV